jgi:hypothetical protein
MVRTHQRRLSFCAAAVWLLACSDAAVPTNATQTPAAPVGALPSATPNAAAAGAPAAPAANMATGTPAVTPPPAANTPMVTPSMQPMAAGTPTPANTDKPAMVDPSMAMNVRPGDTCTDRRVSYAKPCTTEPDPCHIASGWAGDEYCLPPPPAGEGVQIHFGPKDYKDMAEVSKYLIKSGEEFDNSVIAPIDLTTEK